MLQKTGILSLSDEILTLILPLSALLPPETGQSSCRPRTTKRDEPQYDRREVSVLTRVCKRFFRLGSPFLYKEIFFRCNPLHHSRRNAIGADQLSFLYRTLSQVPQLRTYCRSLQIDLGAYPEGQGWLQPPQDHQGMASEIVAWLSSTTEVKIRVQSTTVFGNACPWDVSYEFLRSVTKLPNLQRLSIYDEARPSMDLRPLTIALQGLEHIACLKTLDVAGISNAGVLKDWQALKARAGMAQFTELRLRRFIADPEALKALVMWSSKLEKFSFSLPMSGHFNSELPPRPYGLDTMHRALYMQRDSLIEIYIAEMCLARGGRWDFDFAGFHRLRSIWISRDTTGTRPENAVRLVAPALEHLCWDLALEGKQGRSFYGARVDDFGQAEENFIRSFVGEAMDQKTPLRRIEIPYKTLKRWGLRGGEKPAVYPWDRLDRIARDLERDGITLSYDPPEVTREEFSEMLKENAS